MKRNLCLMLSILTFFFTGLFGVDPVRTPVGPNEVFVTTGEPGFFVTIDLGSHRPSYTFLGGPAFKKLVYGPDGNLYLFAPENGSVSRIDPGAVGSPELIYQAGAADDLTEPEDGWFDAEGSLFVVDRAAGSGVYTFPLLARGASVPAVPVPVLGSAVLGDDFAGAGLTMGYIGNLLVLDRGNGRLLSSSFPDFESVQVLVEGLDNPVAVAQDSRDDLYVADGTTIKRFDMEGNPLSSCYVFDASEQPTSLHFNAGDQLFVSTSAKPSRIWRLDVSGETCTADFFKKVKLPAEGLTFGPTAVDVLKTLTEETQLFGFNSNAFELSSGLPCEATVRFSQTLPSELEALVGSELGFGTGEECGGEEPCASLAIPLGEGGFALAHNLTGSSCPPLEEGYEFSQFLITETLDNPRMVKCEDACFDSDPNCSCLLSELTGELQFRGYYPLNLLQPEDPILVSRGNDFSGFFVIDIDVPEAARAGEFCGFMRPLDNTITLENFDPENPPKKLPTLREGWPLRARFRLADSEQGQCPEGPFIEDASALLAVARIQDADGMPVFEAIDLQSLSGNNPFGLVFDYHAPSQQYIYNIDTTGYLPGIYSLTVVFLESQTESATTFFRVQ
jgi:hypothetical protein